MSTSNDAPDSSEVLEDSDHRPSSFEQIAFETESKVLEILGEPDARWIKKDRIVWYYKDRVDWSDGTPFNGAVHIVEGEVISVVNYPMEWMDDKIATAELNADWLPSEGQSNISFGHEEILGLVQKGDSKQSVVAALGEPSMKSVLRGQEVWQWNDIVSSAKSKSPGDSKSSFIVGFKEGLVIDLDS